MTGSVRVPPTMVGAMMATTAGATAATTAAAMAVAMAVGLPERSTRLDGPRISVRELRADDATACVDAALASRRLHGRWVRPPLTIDDFIARMQKRRLFTNSVSLVARRHDNHAVVGQFNLSEIIRGPLQQAFLGYYGFVPHTGAGYMREGMALVLSHAFVTLRLHRIEANVQPGNVRSVALVEASGFAREGYSERYLKIAGRWRDHERWAINTETWRAHRRASR